MVTILLTFHSVSKCISDELDATLLLGGDIKQYLFFNTRNQNVEISSALPSSHPLQKYNHHNVFNVDKFFKQVSPIFYSINYQLSKLNSDVQYLTSMYRVCATMAARWPEELSQVKLETFTVDYQPCLQCINTDYQDAVYR